MGGIDKNALVFVTGGTGFIGSYIVRTLLHLGYTNIRGLKRTTSSLELLGEVADKVYWTDGDLLDREVLEIAVGQSTYIIHAAAIIAFSCRERNKMLKVNIEGTRDLVNIALERGVKKFIHVSSVSALGRPEDSKRINESTAFKFGKRDSYYGRSKYLSEMEVWRAAAEGLDVAIVNPAMVIGSGFWDRGTARVFKHLHDGINFYPDGSIACVDVRDVARMCIQLLESDIDGERFLCAERNFLQKEILGIMALSIDKQPPKRKLNPILGSFAWRAEWLRTLFNRDIPVITKESLRIANHRYEFDNSKSLKFLQFRYTPIEKTIAQTALQFKEAAMNGFKPNFLALD